MKIEKISDKQIRCTLNGEDLASRQLKLSELAYGSEKAKNLFHDMMMQAKNEFGFNPDNSPIMVEAIPMAPDSIVLNISKVDDPEELDARFSRFSEPGNELSSAIQEKHFSGADEILDLFHKLCDMAGGSEKEAASDTPVDTAEITADHKTDEKKHTKDLNLLQLFQFQLLDTVIEAAHSLNHYYDEQNSLYKDPLTGDYLLVLHQNSISPKNFNRVCNMLSEYSLSYRFYPASEAFLNEHMDCIIRDRAIQTLSEL